MSCAAALTWLTVNTPAVAVLDLHLKDGSGTSIAAVVQTRDVPIIFCSGSDPGDLPDGFDRVSWVHKPFVDGRLVEAVAKAHIRDFGQQMERCR